MNGTPPHHSIDVVKIKILKLIQTNPMHKIQAIAVPLNLNPKPSNNYI